VQFEPLHEFSIVHFGLYWQKIRSAYPRFEVHPPLSRSSDRFERGTLKLELVQSPEPDARCWFIDASETKLIQLQKDRFINNWRKVSGKEIYPRYNQLKPQFADEWRCYNEFLSGERLGVPDVNLCEVTYINSIELGHGWKSYGELSSVIARWSGKGSDDFLPDPDGVSLGTSYTLPERLGRLRIAMEPAVRKKDAKEVLQLTLTAVGKPTSSSLEDILRWFDIGHDWVIRGFVNFTTNTMHRLWGQKT
jgi:uncharacterized protein (TIGR04255 family)